MAPEIRPDLSGRIRHVNRNRASSSAFPAVTSASLRRPRVDADGTRLRLRALHVMGYSPARIARAVDVREITIRAITRGDDPTVSTALRDAIADLYGTWKDTQAPERTRRQRAAAATARRQAIRGNWRAGAGLDDDQLDTPGYRPRSNGKPAAVGGADRNIQLPDVTRIPAQPGPAESSHPCH